MPTERKPLHRAHRGRLSHAQEMTLHYGPDARWDAFHSETEYRDAWIRNRDRMLALCRHGRRPAAWWRFEAGDLRYPGYEREQSTLYEAGLLGEDERTGLLTFWRKEFERAHEPHFFHCEGPGRIFEGAKARRRHFCWADIPRELLKEWTRRRTRNIREPATAAEHPASTVRKSPAMSS